jgi:hypothetical protein
MANPFQVSNYQVTWTPFTRYLAPAQSTLSGQIFDFLHHPTSHLKMPPHPHSSAPSSPGLLDHLCHSEPTRLYTPTPGELAMIPKHPSRSAIMVSELDVRMDAPRQEHPLWCLRRRHSLSIQEVIRAERETITHPWITNRRM